MKFILKKYDPVIFRLITYEGQQAGNTNTV